MSKALDDAHDAATVGTGSNLGPRLWVRTHGRRLDVVWRCPLKIEKFAAEGEFGGAVAVGHEAEMADAVETIGQRMKKEAANELVGLEPHDLCGAVLAIVLPVEGDVVVVEVDEPGCWRWRHDGCSDRDRPGPGRGRRRAAWRKQPS